MSMENGTKHFLFVSQSMWGHLRPDIAITSTLLTLHPKLHITILIHGLRAHDAQREYDRYHLKPDELSRLRKIHFGDVPDAGQGFSKLGYYDVQGSIRAIVENFAAVYVPLQKGEPVLDALTGKPAPTWALPFDIVAFDWCFPGVIPPIVEGMHQALDVPKPRYVMSVPHAPSCFDFHLFDNYDGQPALENVIRAADEGMDPKEAWDKYIASNEEIVHIPGCGPMLRQAVMTLLKPARHAAKTKIAALIVYQSAHIGRASQKAWKESYPLFLVGPLLPPLSDKIEVTTADAGAKVISFLDEAVRNSGQQSVILISFGTLYWPPDAEQAGILLDVLIKMDTPVLFVAGDCTESTRTLLEHRIVASKCEKIMLVSWVPQQRVLRHEAIAAFLTHGGSGGVMESILGGVPLIIWPAGVDQTMIANQLDVVEGIAIELIQIRKTPHMRPGSRTADGRMVHGKPDALRDELTEAFTVAMGSTGQDMRKKISKIQDIIERDRQRGGRTHQALLDVGAL